MRSKITVALLMVAAFGLLATAATTAGAAPGTPADSPDGISTGADLLTGPDEPICDGCGDNGYGGGGGGCGTGENSACLED